MRTNIELDDELIREAKELSGLPTKRAVVEEALRMMVNLKRQAKVKELFGKVQWEGDLDEMRRDRLRDRE
jgi:Arc/MetJ family transcription regulator